MDKNVRKKLFRILEDGKNFSLNGIQFYAEKNYKVKDLDYHLDGNNLVLYHGTTREYLEKILEKGFQNLDTMQNEFSTFFHYNLESIRNIIRVEKEYTYGNFQIKCLIPIDRLLILDFDLYKKLRNPKCVSEYQMGEEQLKPYKIDSNILLKILKYHKNIHLLPMSNKLFKDYDGLVASNSDDLDILDRGEVVIWSLKRLQYKQYTLDNGKTWNKIDKKKMSIDLYKQDAYLFGSVLYKHLKKYKSWTPKVLDDIGKTMGVRLTEENLYFICRRFIGDEKKAQSYMSGLATATGIKWIYEHVKEKQKQFGNSWDIMLFNYLPFNVPTIKVIHSVTMPKYKKTIEVPSRFTKILLSNDLKSIVEYDLGYGIDESKPISIRPITNKDLTTLIDLCKKDKIKLLIAKDDIRIGELNYTTDEVKTEEFVKKHKLPKYSLRVR